MEGTCTGPEQVPSPRGIRGRDLVNEINYCRTKSTLGHKRSHPLVGRDGHGTFIWSRYGAGVFISERELGGFIGGDGRG